MSYLNSIIEFWPGYWEDHFGMMNEVVGEINKFELKSGNKFVVRRLSKK